MNFDEIIKALDEIANPELATDWDNSGIQIYTGTKEVSKILIALELTSDVIKEAKESGVELIITHHPLYFSPIQKIDNNNIIGKYTIELIKSGISVYASHTNFDDADGGNNDYIASVLKLSNIRKFDEGFIGTFGELTSATPLEEVCKYVKDTMGLTSVNAVGNPKAPIKNIGICTGAGGSSDMIGIAFNHGCDLYITGDIKYHDAQYALEKGICLIDAGHYGTEKFFVQNMFAQLNDKLHGKVEILASKIDIDPFTVI